ncbi:response regulator transcription factor [Anaerocolumna xylanovorans]|uniref:Stage 0 sporulation protein A homolog n=1 Tax=Anaerocolumna xylanovorans DSM 12503 TaxID=1121345 RepID=A0A1M7Y908_9FIRM|nr:response regulator transcription factor [Anaerocolumna xylanovorans]SHO49110.1 DNA-binding response regulator, OmpR family, contains REC and winged-helix (wHTH) domain [Anaerocolumna xylanovorans DSM 12503]
MSTILIIEDDRVLNDTLAINLKNAGYHTISSYTASEALESIRLHTFDLILLDVCLPDENGFLLCKSIKNLYNCAIVFLTADDMESSVIKGYDLGAEDYITKPFSFTVLLKKISVIIGRLSHKTGAQIYKDGYLEVNFNSQKVIIDGKLVELTPLEFKTLKLLIDNSGRVLTREILLDKLWDCRGNYVDETSLNAIICRIRSKVDKQGCHHIKTIYGTGYMWLGDIYEK